MPAKQIIDPLKGVFMLILELFKEISCGLVAFWLVSSICVLIFVGLLCFVGAVGAPPP